MKRGLVVLEGADACGKTTLARHLVDKFRARYLHLRYHEDIWRRQLGALSLAVKWAEHHLVVIDRLWMSENVYGEVYRQKSKMAVSARCLDRLVMKHAGVYVLCVPDDTEAQVKLHATRKDKEMYDDIREVALRFRDLLRGNPDLSPTTYFNQLVRHHAFVGRPDMLQYDMYRHKLSEGEEMIAARLQTMRHQQAPMALTCARSNMLGSLRRATTLVVGDRPSPRAGTGWPFLWSDAISAATWLNRACHQLAVDESKVVVTNANVDDTLDQLLRYYQWKNVVALGREAQKRVAKNTPVFHEVLHPQVPRRFPHMRKEFMDQLRKGMKDARHPSLA